MAAKKPKKSAAVKAPKGRRGSSGTSRRKVVAPGDPISIRAYADSRKARGLKGTSHTAVRKAKDSGRLSRCIKSKPGPKGGYLIYPDIADEEWDETTDSRQQRDVPEPEEPEPTESRQPTLFGEPEAVEKKKSSTATIQEHRSEIEFFRARKAEAEYQQVLGNLVDYGLTYEEVFRLFRLIRDRTFGIKARLSQMLAAETDWREVNKILDDELRKVFTEAADSFEGKSMAADESTGEDAVTKSA